MDFVSSLANQNLESTTQMDREDANFLVLYGTETGTAQDVAKYLCKLSLNRSFKRTRMMSMDQYHDVIGMGGLPSECLNGGVLIFVVSTTGDGEIPPTMEKFWKVLLRRDLPAFSIDTPLNFAIFGLGDSSYQKFNATARRLGTRLLQLRGNEICQRGYGDDQSEKGLWGDVDSWLPHLWGYLDSAYPLPPDFVVDDTPKLQPSKYKVELVYNDTEGQTLGILDAGCKGFYDSVAPVSSKLRAPLLMGTLKVNKRLTAPDWTQDVRHIEIELPVPVSYVAGDVAVLCPENDKQNIQDFLKSRSILPNQKLCLELNPDYIPMPWDQSTDTMDLPSECTALDLFARYLDTLGTPRRDFFEHLSVFAEDEEEKAKLLELSSSDGADLLHDYCTREKRSYIEVLEDFPSCQIELAQLVGMIRKLQPRSYSVASTSLVDAQKVDLCVAVVQYLTPYRRNVTGICSAWLASLEENSPVPLWIRKGTFTAPQDVQRPVILVGPGTGVAPMRAMLHERRLKRRLLSQSSQGNVHDNASAESKGNLHAEEVSTQSPDVLFFGCRYSAKDFLYSQEWAQFEEEGILAPFYAFSRETIPKTYVTKKILEVSSRLNELLLHQNACIYVSGSAKNMPTNVWDSFVEVLVKENQNLKQEESVSYFRRMQQKKRYCVEAWS